MVLLPFCSCQVSVSTSYNILSTSGGNHLANGVGLELICTASYDTFGALQYIEFNTNDGETALACAPGLVTGDCTSDFSFTSGVQVSVANDVVTVEIESYDEAVHEIDYKCKIFNNPFTLENDDLFGYPSSTIWGK